MDAWTPQVFELICLNLGHGLIATRVWGKDGLLRPVVRDRNASYCSTSELELPGRLPSCSCSCCNRARRMLPLHVKCVPGCVSSCFLHSLLGLGCSHRGFVRVGFSRQRFGGSPSKVRDPSGSRVFPINKVSSGWMVEWMIMIGFLRLDCWTWRVFLFLLRFWGYCIFGIYGERLVFLGGFGRVGVGLCSLVIGLWGWLKVLFQHSSLGIFEVPRVATWQGSLGNPTKPSTS